MEIKQIKEKVLSGADPEKEELLSLMDCDLRQLTKAADEIRTEKCGNQFELCTIINGRSGRCTEDCRYCAQSIHYVTKVEEYDLLDGDEIEKSAESNEKAGVHRFSIVTSGRAMHGEQIDQLCRIYRKISQDLRIELCASHGLASFEDLKKLKEAGVKRYHNNLETSRSFFPHMCTTHSYDDKIKTIYAAKAAGLQVCSGGIIGLGETMEDRIDMALALRGLEVDSVPLNVLNPIAGTPLEKNPMLSYDEIKRTAAIFRFVLPDIQIRLAGGRSLMPDKGKSLMQGGINAAISGDMLTTAGISTQDDIAMLREIGYGVRR